MATKYEYNDTGNSVSNSSCLGRYDAQTFTIGTVGANENFAIYSVILRLDRQGTVNNVTVSIRAVDGNGKPTGPDLCSKILAGTAVGISVGDVEFIFTTNPTLTKSTKYVICLTSDVNCADGRIRWYLNGSSSYAGGSNGYSLDGGVTWSFLFPFDTRFQVYGTRLQTVYTLTALTGSFILTGINAILSVVSGIGIRPILKIKNTNSILKILDIKPKSKINDIKPQ